jgi:Zn-dependent M32 family carboxypeptidase|tara:strand:+ start:489 stop:674 length:186 start_codon:yes stop_codon:yes gene_type:complete
MNPVSKVRKIVEAITTDNLIQNKLLEVMTRNLTVKQIEKVFEELKPTYQLKLNLCSEDLKK